MGGWKRVSRIGGRGLGVGEPEVMRYCGSEGRVDSEVPELVVTKAKGVLGDGGKAGMSKWVKAVGSCNFGEDASKGDRVVACRGCIRIVQGCGDHIGYS